MRQIVKIASVLSAVLWVAGCEQKVEHTPQQQGPTEVSVVDIATQAQSIMVELPGRSKAYMEAEVRPQVNGIIMTRGFVEGSDVVKGESLYQIDASTYESVLVGAKADLKSAQANLVSAKAKVTRFAKLIKQNSISQQDFDNADATYKDALARVTVAKAAINTAKINLEYTQVRAPISGRIGISAVTPGALVTANQGQTLATIQQLDPINIDIVQSSAQLLRLKFMLRDGQLKAAENSNVQLILEDGSQYSHAGLLQFSEVSVNENTGSVILRAEFPNPDGILMPGMYVRAVLNIGTDPEAILVPQKAITRNPKGEAVAMVVDKAGNAAARIVTTAEVIDNQWRITEGLAVGDQLIIDGLQKIRPGAPVKAVSLLTDNVSQPTPQKLG